MLFNEAGEAEQIITNLKARLSEIRSSDRYFEKRRIEDAITFLGNEWGSFSRIIARIDKMKIE